MPKQVSSHRRHGLYLDVTDYHIWRCRPGLPTLMLLLPQQVNNFRAAKLGNPCLLLEYTGPAAAVLLEHDWTDVWAAVPAPMFRHRYGT